MEQESLEEIEAAIVRAFEPPPLPIMEEIQQKMIKQMQEEEDYYILSMLNQM